ncbi:MAG: STAS domain-containing protein [Spirochaetales bacterium]|jgi:anti-anti-sigma factor|nr:STAS domain-containing protein [Spirochaetales bacterium]
MENTKNQLLIASKGNDLYFQTLGHITANLCFPLRNIIMKRISSFSVPFEINIDLSQTSYMDSTFLGIMVALDKAIFAKLKTHVYIVCPNEISLKLLKNMGLDKFLKIKDTPIPEDLVFERFDDSIDIDELEQLKIVLDSHDKLCELSEENQKRFGALCKILQNQLAEKN